jgi:hypothetical protein
VQVSDLGESRTTLAGAESTTRLLSPAFAICDITSSDVTFTKPCPVGFKNGTSESFFFFFFFKSTIYNAVLDRSPRQTIQTKYSLRVYKCKIGRETTALTSPFRAVMSPARTKRGQENDKEHWALRRLPKPALAPDGHHPQHAQSTPKDVPSRGRTRV